MKHSKNTTSNFNNLIKQQKNYDLNISQKYLKFSSVPSYFSSKSKSQKISSIYRTLSTNKVMKQNKKIISGSTNLSPAKKNILKGKKPEKSNTYLICSHEKTKRLKLYPKDKKISYQKLSNTINDSVYKKLTEIHTKLQNLIKFRINKLFIQEYKHFWMDLKYLITNQSKIHEIIQKIFKLIENCEEKKKKINDDQLTQKYMIIEQNNTKLICQVKRKVITIQRINKQLQKISTQSLQLQKRLKKLTQTNKIKILDSQQINYMVQTQSQASQKKSDMTQLIYMKQLQCVKCQQLMKQSYYLKKRNKNLKQKLKKFSKKQKQIMKVFLELKKFGIDVEGVYEQIINEEENEQDKNETVSRKIRVSTTGDIDADQSIIESIDALSFNYQNKTLQDDVYTVKMEYKLQNQLPTQLKKQLHLDFECFYEQYQENNEVKSRAPTI